MWTVLSASKEQIDKIYENHVKNKVFNLKFSYDEDDGIGFVSFKVKRGDTVVYQMRGENPCFVEFQTTERNIRYDIDYPEGPLFERLKELGLKAAKDFWAGGEL